MVLRLVRASSRLLDWLLDRPMTSMPLWVLHLAVAHCSSWMRTFLLDIISFSLRCLRCRLRHLARRTSQWGLMFLCRRRQSLTSWGVELSSRLMMDHHLDHLEVERIQASGV